MDGCAQLWTGVCFKDDEVSVGIRGPVSIHPAFSVDPITIDSLQITKSVNSITGSKKSSDTAWAPSTGWDLRSTPPSAASTASWRKRPIQ